MTAIEEYRALDDAHSILVSRKLQAYACPSISQFLQDAANHVQAQLSTIGEQAFAEIREESYD